MNNLEIPQLYRNDPVYPKYVAIRFYSIDYAILFILLLGFFVINMLAQFNVLPSKTILKVDIVLISFILTIMLPPLYFQYKNARHGYPITTVVVRGNPNAPYI